LQLEFTWHHSLVFFLFSFVIINPEIPFQMLWYLVVKDLRVGGCCPIRILLLTCLDGLRATGDSQISRAEVQASVTSLSHFQSVFFWCGVASAGLRGVTSAMREANWTFMIV
jgi:hypothetical protein